MTRRRFRVYTDIIRRQTLSLSLYAVPRLYVTSLILQYIRNAIYLKKKNVKVK